jgi:hypothetical protein
LTDELALSDGLAPRRSACHTFGMASETETVALRMLCVLYDATDGLPLLWRMSVESDRKTADAIEFAVAQGWVIVEDGYSICLTDAGRHHAHR